MVNYFWDSYALILLLNGDPRVREYVEKSDYIVTSSLNIMELYYYLLKNNISDMIIKDLLIACKIIDSIPVPVITEAATIRYEKHKKGKKWSYIDSIGYVLAKKLGIKFLTGDKEFEGEENVEFIK